MENMGPLSTKLDSDVPTDNLQVPSEDEKPKLIYAVYIPADAQISADVSDISSVFDDKAEALKLVKKYKRARFKVCSSFAEATLFSSNGGGASQNTPQQVSVSADTQPVILTGEKPSPFKGPKSQELVLLRKAIENGDFHFVQQTVWDNPRYLVSSGDTPSILHEGTRYNALHVCAKTGNAAICALVLKTVSNIDFIRRLYGDVSESIEAAEDRCRVLLDLYLNMPDKGFNETPLHFASKHGSYEVVKVLVAYPQCIKDMLNKHGQTPRDIICSRVSGSGDNGFVRETIKSLLDEQFFVPVLRSCDPTVEPAIGQPFSPARPLNLSGDLKSPVREVLGVAGPMPLDAAKTFRKNWKTPPRDPKSPLRKVVIHDPIKGLENIGRRLAQECNVQWKEYWPFLETFTDLRSEEGLDLLEKYLMTRFIIGQDSPWSKSKEGFNVTPSRPSVHESLPNSPRSPFTSNSDSCSGKTILSPISELCIAMQSCKLSDSVSSRSTGDSSSDRNAPSQQPTAPPPPPPLQQLKSSDSRDESEVPISLHLYIEKSCQVFAKRIADGLLRCPDTGAEILMCEAVHLNMLISSYLTDVRFSSINFARFHHRIAMCLVHKLEDPYDEEIIKKAVDLILAKQHEKNLSSSEEDEALIQTPYRDISRKRYNCGRRKVDVNVLCISQQISKCLQEERISPNEPLPSTEVSCIEAWESAVPCHCEWTVPAGRRRHYSLGRSYVFNSKDDQKISTSPSLCVNNQNNCQDENSSGESETSDDEFVTPPSTPRDCRSISSEDDFDVDSPDEGPDVYIVGDSPSYLDNAVLQALDEITLDVDRYPNICRWKHLVSLHSHDDRKRWTTQPKRTSTPCSTPSSTPTPSKLLTFHQRSLSSSVNARKLAYD